jgi:hypothetical protein
VIRLAAGLLLTGLPGVAVAAVLIVHPDGSGDFPTIQAAIDAASTGDVIELLDGTFTGNGNRDIDYRGKAVTVRSRGGDPARCVIDCQGSRDSEHRGFRFLSGEGPDSILEGVTVTNGFPARDAATGRRRGGGVICLGASPTIRSCVFDRNRVLGVGVTDAIGSGAYFLNSTATLTGCVLLENSAQDCAALYCKDGVIDLIACDIAGNLSSRGGAIGGENATLTLVDCELRANTARSVSGGIRAVSTTLAMRDCVLDGNTCGVGSGGAISARGGSLDLSGTMLAGNRVVDFGHGGAVAVTGTRTTIDGCTFVGNSCYGDGGALFGDGAEARVLRSTIIGNESAQGTISLTNGSSAVVENTLITANAIISVWCDGGSSAALSCCDVYGNSNPGGTIDGDWVPCIAGQAGAAGNIGADPKFCSAAPAGDLDFTLRVDSPCAPPQSSCGLVGAWDVACDADPVEPSTWGKIKSRYRAR